MSNPTTPFSWQMPTATDLVTDLPADFAVFGQAVATSMQYLLGGTTGQILSKTSATDMAFTWTTPNPGDITGVTAGTGISGGGTSGTVTVTNDMATTITTNGDLIYGTGSGTYTRRGIGSTSQVLTVSGGVPTWATPSAKVIQVISASTTTATTIASTSYTDSGLSATITPTLNTSKILVMTSQVVQVERVSNQANHGVRLLRGVTSIGEFGDASALYSMGFIVGNSTQITQRTIMTINYMDAPATTSATTYKIQGACNTTANSDTFVFQNQGLIGNMILMEIGA